jgi:hypothetical protein
VAAVQLPYRQHCKVPQYCASEPANGNPVMALRHDAAKYIHGPSPILELTGTRPVAGQIHRRWELADDRTTGASTGGTKGTARKAMATAGTPVEALL